MPSAYTLSTNGRAARSSLTALATALALGTTLAACSDQPTSPASSSAESSLAKASSGGKPQRNRIAFAQTDGQGSFDIYTMNPDGTGVVPLTSNGFVFDGEPPGRPTGARSRS